MAHLWRCPPRNDFTEREIILVARVGMLAAAAGPISAPPKSKGAESRLDAFVADEAVVHLFEALGGGWVEHPDERTQFTFSQVIGGQRQRPAEH
jgi:hypothetical protein